LIDPNFKVQFTPDNEILISFYERMPKAEPATKNTTENSSMIFVVLLFSGENGELINRME